jgi:peptidoglycan-associated lipoprotein
MKNLALPALAACALALSCAHNPETKTETTNAPTSTTPPPAQEQPQAAGDKTCAADTDCGDKQLCIRTKCVDISLGLAECSQLRVHFDFDKADVKDEDKTGLERIARCLRADHALKVTVEGNADERGTEEYNLALGQRRAGVVDEYLVRLGVSGNQLKTISYGFERPVCTQHNEQCWAKNRRAAVKPHDEANSK